MPHFEVLERDGPGRIGELRLKGETVETPLLATHGDDDLRLGALEIEDSGTLYRPRDGDTAPDAPSPLKADDRVLRHLSESTTQTAREEGPLAAIAHGGENSEIRRNAAETLSKNYRLLYVGSASALDQEPRKLVSAIQSIREAARPDTAIYAPGLARPWSIPLLIYSGIDVLDDSSARIAAARGTYMTQDGARGADEVEEPVCPCPACTDGAPTDFKSLLNHNRAALQTEVNRARAAIRRGQLRELVEQRTRTLPWLVSALRHLDDAGRYVERHTPTFRKAEMLAYGEETLRRAEIRQFARRVQERYDPPEADAVAILPCSAGKPYSTSRSHGRFRTATRGRCREIVLTSPVGAVPRELEMIYPAAHYDVPVTGDWTQEEVDWMAQNLETQLRDRHYETVAAHVRDAGYLAAVERVEEKLGLDVTYTSRDHHPLSDESMDRLRDALAGHSTDFDRYRETLRSLTDHMLGRGAGEGLRGDVRGRYPLLRLEDGDETLATTVPEYGALAFTLDAAHLFPDEYTVKIDNFVPKGSILAPGVVEAPPGIRVGDEVLVDGPSARCVGRARMPGTEMTRSKRGIAIDVRHREEK